MPNPPNNLGSNQLGTVAFSTGLSANGALNSMNGWNWAGTTPATYGSATESAHKWGGDVAGTPGGTVTYYFDPGSGFSASVESMYVSALTLWSDEADISFVQTDDPSQAQISFYLFNTATPNVPLDNGAWAVAAYKAGKPGDTSIPETQGVSLSIEQTGSWAHLDSFSYAGGYGPSTIVHELGHAMGLMHTGPYNGGDVPAPPQQYNTTDMYLWSTMSYIAPYQTNAKYYDQYPVKDTNFNTQVSSSTPQILDILGVQQLYGLPTSTTFSGGQTFGFNSNISDAAAPFFDFTQNTDPVVTIWDRGKNNTLDLSGFYTPSVVNLNPGTFSNADGMVNNIAIAYNTAIDTAIGGAANDTFTVNSDSDTIDGGGGSNTVKFPGAYASYVITALGKGAYSISNGAVTDKLSNIQTLTFADQTIAVSKLPADDTFSWNVGNGAYSDKTSWTDVTKGGPATSPPGATDIALVPGPTSGGPQTISGDGVAAQMAFTGLSGVTGDLTPGLLTVGQGGGQAAMLTIAPGATIAATSAAVPNGTLRVIGTLTTANTLTLVPADAASTSSIEMRSGGIAQVGTLVMNGGSVGVDSTSSFEVGTAGNTAAGYLTIDAGSTMTGNGALQAVIDVGTVVASGGTLSVDSLGGKAGQASIAPDGTLKLGASTTIPISFAATTGTLALTAPQSAMRTLGNVNDFDAGDVISITALDKDNKPQPLQQATYDPETGNTVVQAAGGGSGVSATLVGDFSNYVFLLQPTGTGVFSLLTAVGSLSGSTVPSGGTQDGHMFAWAAGQSGDWKTAANWKDLSKNPQVIAPGSKDNAFVQGANQPNAVQVISGAANVNNLLFAGANAISGTVTVGGTLTVGQIGNPASLALIGTAALSAGNATLTGGMLDVASGTSLSVTNGLSIASDPAQSVAPLEIYGGGKVQVGSLNLSGTMAPIALDSASIVEVGTDGGAEAGSLTVDANNTVSGTGDLSAIDVADAGTIIADGGSLSLGTVDGKGSLDIGANATLALAGSEANPIAFTGATATLLVKSAQATLGTVTGFVQGETFAVTALPQALPTDVAYTKTGANIGTLSLTNKFGTKITATLAGDYTGANFVLGPGSSSTVVDVTIACFAAGTRIATERGSVAVEHLQEGDLVSVHFAHAPLAVAWIGHRHVDCRRHPEPRRVWPVRIQAGSFGPSVPSRDLMLSPDHAVLVEDVLIPVKYLINGTTIAQIEMDELTYYHVELARHDVLSAEGVPAESYLDTGDRAKFANGGAIVTAYPDFATRLWEADGCAPLVVTGPALEAARQRVAQQCVQQRHAA